MNFQPTNWRSEKWCPLISQTIRFRQPITMSQKIQQSESPYFQHYLMTDMTKLTYSILFCRFQSEKTGRGPLTGPDWIKNVSPVMTCYKLVTCEFKWFGFQSKVESFIQKTERRLFTKFHRWVIHDSNCVAISIILIARLAVKYFAGWIAGMV